MLARNVYRLPRQSRRCSSSSFSTISFSSSSSIPTRFIQKSISIPSSISSVRRLATHTNLPPTSTSTTSTSTSSNKKPQTLVEKIVQRYAVDLNKDHVVQAGDYVSIKPNIVMTHDNTGPCIDKFQSIGGTKIKDPRQVVYALDHDVQNKSQKNLSKYSKIESFARSQGVDFYPAGRGIGHQVMVEEGYAFPLTLAVASDSHSNMYGGIGCLGTPVVRTDAAAIWASGQTWWQIPEIVKVELKGNLKKGVTGKDVIVALCGYFNQDQVLNSAIEFTGEGVSNLSIDERLAISNMTTEWGALAGVFPVDAETLKWYRNHLNKLDKLNFQVGSSPSIKESHPRLNQERLTELENEIESFKPDEGAFYSRHLILDLNTLSPHVSGPNSVKLSTPLETLKEKDIKVQKAYLVSCVNSRSSDLAAAASVVKGKKIAEGVEFYVAAASSVVQKESEESGDWGILMAAGAKPLPAGCGPCIGLGVGLLQDGEVGISATNRNYKGRMGSPNAEAYLASPAVVAASAVAGKICGPDDLDLKNLPGRNDLKFSIAINSPMTSAPPPPPPSSESESESESKDQDQDLLLPGFPKSFSGPLIFAPQDNLNTDGIYPGKYTYQDDITPTKQSEVVMENYDPNFSKTVSKLREEYSLPFYDDSKTLTTSNDSKVESSSSSSNEERKGIILIGGYNFGTGSSREQAATALKYSGIPLVISGSFGDIFKRNSINNGLICLECPELVEDLTRELGRDGKRNNGGKEQGEISVLLDGGKAEINVRSKDGHLVIKRKDGSEKVYTTRPAGIGKSVQDIFTAGGLEAWVKKRLD